MAQKACQTDFYFTGKSSANTAPNERGLTPAAQGV
jgi:hypothetical protein